MHPLTHSLSVFVCASSVNSTVYFILLVCSQEGTYAYQDENGSLALLSGIPAALVSCKRMGELPGCLFKFDDPDAQCADGRRGKTL